MPQELDKTNKFIDAEQQGRRGRQYGWSWHHHAQRPHGRHPAGGEAPAGQALLSRARVGNTVRVAEVHGDQAFSGKMMAMGLVPGAALTVLQGGGGRPLLIALSGSRFFVDWRSSELIAIRAAEPEREKEGEKT